MESATVNTSPSAPPGLGRPKEWEEVLNKISQPQFPPHASTAPVPRSPHGKNRAKSKTANAPAPAALGVDLLWALDMLEPIALPNPQIQKEEAGVVLHGLCIIRQVFLAAIWHKFLTFSLAARRLTFNYSSLSIFCKILLASARK